MKIEQPIGGKPDYDLKQNQQPMRSSPDSQNLRNASSVLQNSHADTNPSGLPQPKPSGLPQPKPIAARRSPTEEQKQNGTNGKAVRTFFGFLIISCRTMCNIDCHLDFVL